MMMTSQRTRSVENAKSEVGGRKKVGWQSTVDPAISGGPVEGRRMSRGGPKQRFDVSRPGPAKFSYADRAKLCNNDRA